MPDFILQGIEDRIKEKIKEVEDISTNWKRTFLN